jgi:hypothetical protein
MHYYEASLGNFQIIKLNLFLNNIISAIYNLKIYFNYYKIILLFYKKN